MFDEDGASVMACAELDVPTGRRPRPPARRRRPASSVSSSPTLRRWPGSSSTRRPRPAPRRLGRRRRGDEHAHHERVYASAGPVQGYQAQTDLRAGTTCRAGYAGTATARRSTSSGRRGGDHDHHGDALAGHALHDVGYLEAGSGQLRVDPLGLRVIGYAKAFMSELRVDDEALALDEIKAVGPGGDHLARPYTRHYREIWQSDLLDTSRHAHWWRRARRPSTACGRGRRCAPSPAPSRSTPLSWGARRIPAGAEERRPGS